MNLKQLLIKEAMKEAGQKIATIDANTGLIAECEALAAQLQETGLIDACATITVHDTQITARVSCYGDRVSDVLQAICNAGLTASEIAAPAYLENWPNSRSFRIAGFDAPVHIVNPIADLAQAA